MEQVMLVIASMNTRLGDVEKSLTKKNTSTIETDSNLTPAEAVSSEVTVQVPSNHDSSLPSSANGSDNTNPWLQPHDRRAHSRRQGSANGRQLSASRQQSRQPHQPRQAPRQRQNGSRSRQTFIGKKVMTGELSWGGVELLSH